MKQLLCVAVCEIALCGLIGFSPASEAAEGPEIFSLEPDAAPGGSEIHVTGKRLQNTQQVLFAFDQFPPQPGWPFLRVLPAKFQVVSEQELKVTTPLCLTTGAKATVVIVSADGITVGLPPTVATIRESAKQVPGKKEFYHVLNGGTLKAANGATAVEAGGIVLHSGVPTIHFVKKGGTLIDGRYGLVLHEPGAILGEHVKSGSLLKVVEVPHINLSLGIEPFIFTAAVGLPGASKAVPLIRSIEPDEAAPGDIILLRGDGFTGTLEVAFPGSGGSLKTGFRVLSDNELWVQVPDGPSLGKQIIAVANVNGATITASPDNMVTSGEVGELQLPPSSPPRRPGERLAPRWSGKNSQGPLVLVGKGLVEKTPENGAFYVADGGTLVNGGRVLFVKHGGRVADVSKATIVFGEPGAAIGSGAERPETIQRVASIQLSPLARAFVINPQKSALPEGLATATQAVPTSVAPQPISDRAEPRDEPRAKATRPPQIDAISPPKATPGAVIELRGYGFTGTTYVFFLREGEEPDPATFQVLSDVRLKVDVPKWGSGQQLIVVVNSEGLTVTEPRSPSAGLQLLDHVGAGGSATWGGRPRLYIVENGGAITHLRNRFTVFLKNGAVVGESSGNGSFFYEPDAVIPEAIKKNSENAFLEVKQILPSTGVKPFFVESK